MGIFFATERSPFLYVPESRSQASLSGLMSIL